ncbi:hypothetical protein HanIR_Chr05g0234171 [Helianthus annuus]|nr:hypothetical protein HanIR_Chr05g0234171 [Helianthus annuus]
MSSSLFSFKDKSQTDAVTSYPLPFHSSNRSLISFWFLEQVCTAAPNPASSSTIA